MQACTILFPGLSPTSPDLEHAASWHMLIPSRGSDFLHRNLQPSPASRRRGLGFSTSLIRRFMRCQWGWVPSHQAFTRPIAPSHSYVAFTTAQFLSALRQSSRLVPNGPVWGPGLYSLTIKTIVSTGISGHHSVGNSRQLLPACVVCPLNSLVRVC